MRVRVTCHHITISNRVRGAMTSKDAASSGSGALLSTPALLALLALQFGAQPLLTSRLASESGATKSSIVLATETIKALVAVALFARVAEPSRERRRALLASWTPAGALARAGPPAAVYALTNWLILVVRRASPPRSRCRFGEDGRVPSRAARRAAASLARAWVVDCVCVRVRERGARRTTRGGTRVPRAPSSAPSTDARLDSTRLDSTRRRRTSRP